jgi:hypothetical protein
MVNSTIASRAGMTVRFEAGILMIGKIKPTVAIPTELRLIFSESEPVDIQDFCWNGGRFHDYLPLTSLENGIVSMLIRDEPRQVKSFSHTFT